MKLKESTVHYLWVFGSIGTFALVALAGWEMAEHSIWFEQYWSHKPSRFLIIFAGTLTTIGLAAYTYSYFWGRKKFIRTYKEIKRDSFPKNCICPIRWSQRVSNPQDLNGKNYTT